MREPAPAIVVVGDIDPLSGSVLRDAGPTDLRRASTLSDVPALCSERPADVVLLWNITPSSFDPAVINNLRRQDAALARYTCIVQCSGAAHEAAPIVGVDDLLSLPVDTAGLAQRLELYRRVARLETEVQMLKRRIPDEELLMQDALTGLGNWRYLTHRLEAVLLDARARGGLVSCALLSVDRLDHIGERHGRAARDEILRGVAARLRKTLRPTDVVARTSDNEFGIALRFADGGHLRPWVFERLQRAIGYPTFMVGQQELPISVSVGVYCNDGKDEITPFDMLASAAARMREAQEAGGDTVKM